MIHLRITFIAIALLALHNKSTNCSKINKALGRVKDSDGSIPFSTMLALRTDPVINYIFSELKELDKSDKRRDLEFVNHLINLVRAEIGLLESKIARRNRKK